MSNPPFFLARPDGGTAGKPAVVVCMEGNGMSQQLLRVCQRLAAEGYTAIAPDMFHRFGGSDGDRAMAEGWYSKLGVDGGLDDVAAAVAELRAAGATKIGITGFCMGGMFSYAASLRGLVDCAVGFYGRISEMLGTPHCPQLHFFGGSDAFIPMSEIDKVTAHHPAETTVYADADHGFMRDGSPNYHPEHAPVAWARTLAFFREHLG